VLRADLAKSGEREEKEKKEGGGELQDDVSAMLKSMDR